MARPEGPPQEPEKKMSEKPLLSRMLGGVALLAAGLIGIDIAGHFFSHRRSR